MNKQWFPKIAVWLVVLMVLVTIFKHFEAREAENVTTLDYSEFIAQVNDRKIMAVPSIYLNGENFGQGRMGLEEILSKIDTSAAEKEAAKIATKEAAAIAHNQLFFNAREPMRWAACTTMAVTAGLIP